MKNPLQHGLRIGALAATLGVLGAPACWAQIGFSNGSGGVGPAPSIGPPAQSGAAAPRVQPPALPGAKTDESRVAPATTPPLQMEPTLALFDAINRGDLASARDAVNRGADLGGHNVLGMTPMELSVDLGRNDISFMLLSMRGADSNPPPPPAADAKARAGASARPVREARARVAAPLRVVAPPPRTAQLYAGDGGAPVPQAGFLGFGGAGRN
jgi:hypothetical protein